MVLRALPYFTSARIFRFVSTGMGVHVGFCVILSQLVEGHSQGQLSERGASGFGIQVRR